VITAVIEQTIAKIEIKGKDFEEDLTRFKADIPAPDRKFDDIVKMWIVKNPENYKHVPYILHAIEDRERQPTLF
jgi:hypothetical protein